MKRWQSRRFDFYELIRTLSHCLVQETDSRRRQTSMCLAYKNKRPNCVRQQERSFIQIPGLSSFVWKIFKNQIKSIMFNDNFISLFFPLPFLRLTTILLVYYSVCIWFSSVRVLVLIDVRIWAQVARVFRPFEQLFSLCFAVFKF